jgi:hypothetical protein
MQDDMARNMKTMQENQVKADAHQANFEALTEMTARMDTRHNEMLTWLKDLKFNREEMMACQEPMEARLEEDKPASEERTPEVAQEQEVTKEDAIEMPVGEPRKRRRDQRHLVAQRRQKEEERDLDARRRVKQWNLVAARRGTTRRAKVARRKEN